MIGGLARLGKWFIDSGMRKGTPKEKHENVITVYGGVEPWKKRVEYKDPKAAYLIPIYWQGIVLMAAPGSIRRRTVRELGGIGQSASCLELSLPEVFSMSLLSSWSHHRASRCHVNAIIR